MAFAPAANEQRGERKVASPRATAACSPRARELFVNHLRRSRRLHRRRALEARCSTTTRPPPVCLCFPCSLVLRARLSSLDERHCFVSDTRMMQLSASATSLSVPQSINDIADVASSFDLKARWIAPAPSTSSLEALALPTNTQDQAAAWLVNDWNVSSTTLSNSRFVDDPFGDDGLVLGVNYPKGTRDGEQFFMTPIRVDSKVQTAVLQYEVRAQSVPSRALRAHQLCALLFRSLSMLDSTLSRGANCPAYTDQSRVPRGFVREETGNRAAGRQG